MAAAADGGAQAQGGFVEIRFACVRVGIVEIEIAGLPDGDHVDVDVRDLEPEDRGAHLRRLPLVLDRAADALGHPRKVHHCAGR